jgi:hypothetical protein
VGVGAEVASLDADPVAAAAHAVTHRVSHRDGAALYAEVADSLGVRHGASSPSASAILLPEDSAAGGDRGARARLQDMVRPEARARVLLGCGGSEELLVHVRFARRFHFVEDDETSGELDYACGTLLQAAQSLLRLVDIDMDLEEDDDVVAIVSRGTSP